MMNAGCFSFEVISCPEARNDPAGSPDVRICVIMVFIAMIILIILLIVCAEARLIGDMTVNGEAPDQDFCERIRCASSVGRMESSPRRPW